MKKEEFIREAEHYVRFWTEKFESSSEPVPVTDPMKVDVVLTCHTEGCPLQDKSYWHSADVSFDGVYKVLCAPCRRPIEDIDPLFEDDPDFRFPTRYPDGKSWLKEAW